MLSKGGKIEWFCPVCASPNIRQGKMYGQNSGFCQETTCRTWWPWRERIKLSVGGKKTPKRTNGYINLYPKKQ